MLKGKEPVGGLTSALSGGILDAEVSFLGAPVEKVSKRERGRVWVTPTLRPAFTLGAYRKPDSTTTASTRNIIA